MTLLGDARRWCVVLAVSVLVATGIGAHVIRTPARQARIWIDEPPSRFGTSIPCVVRNEPDGPPLELRIAELDMTGTVMVVRTLSVLERVLSYLQVPTQQPYAYFARTGSTRSMGGVLRSECVEISEAEVQRRLHEYMESLR